MASLTFYACKNCGTLGRRNNLEPVVDVVLPRDEDNSFPDLN